MKYFFDTEFIEDGRTIELLSIGIVAEDGREFYAEVDQRDVDYEKADAWVKENVIAHLGHVRPLRREQLKRELFNFVGVNKPEFWAYYADYDWVVFCQLFGRMIDLPKGWPMYCRDVKQLCADLGNPALPEQDSTKHHALEDARWTKESYEFLRSLTK